jgi:Conserved TM helix
MQGTAVAVPVRDTGDAFKASLAGALNTFLSAIPRIIGFAVVLIVGWIVSSVLARGVQALLHAVKFNDLARRSGFADFVQKMGVRDDSSGVIASIVKWFVRLVTLVVAFDTLGLPAFSNVLNQLLLWLPNLIVALVVLVIGGLAANALARLVRGTTAAAGFSNPDTLETVTRVAVWSFAIVVAVNQLGIATTLINTLLIGVVGALALAFGLAFGLGGRDRAAQVLDTMGRNVQRAGPRLERAASMATQAASEGAASMSTGAGEMSQRSHSPIMDASWVERAHTDRRRVSRPGLRDRRTGNGSNGS